MSAAEFDLSRFASIPRLMHISMVDPMFMMRVDTIAWRTRVERSWDMPYYASEEWLAVVLRYNDVSVVTRGGVSVYSSMLLVGGGSINAFRTLYKAVRSVPEARVTPERWRMALYHLNDGEGWQEVAKCFA